MTAPLLQRGHGAGFARRGVLGAGAATIGAATLGVAATPETAEAAAAADPDVTGRRNWGGTELPPTIQRRILTRFTYGFVQDDYVRMRDGGGWSAWFEKQLTPSTLPDPRLDDILASLPDLYLPAADQALQANTGRKPPTHIQQQYFAATVARRVYSTRQVEAMMEDFWSNHFYVAGQLYLHADYTRTLRQLAFGRFEDLLVAAELHPAMLMSLSTSDSTKEHPNENQAREMMELHTVGRGGAGYTEDTVQQVARLLTGWHVDEYVQTYDPARHWTGGLQALGWSHANASTDGREATLSFLKHLAHLPATAERICRKLAVRFVSDTPSDALVSSLAQVYLANDTQIKPVLRALIRHTEFVNGTAKKLRTPLEDCVGVIRAAGIGVRPADPVEVGNSAFLNLAWTPAKAGQPLQGWSRPDGYPDVATAWDGPSRAEAMLAWHWLATSRDDPTFVGATRPSGVDLLPASSLRFDQFIDHLSKLLFGFPATDRMVRAACAVTGLAISAVVNSTSAATNDDWPRVLVSLFDSPDWLWK